MNQAPDDLPRLIHDALEELGWNADVSAIADRVRRLDLGLPAEDEFAVLCSWLGKCELLHKLDQHQIPLISKEKYQVPDLLALFSTQKVKRPVLIEVKCKNDNTLSFKPNYLNKLKNYSDISGMPVLIAWKYYSIWVLFDLIHLKKSKVNFNISLSDAMRENLLGPLVGDVMYKVACGSGINIKLAKERREKIENDGDVVEETWMVRLSSVEFMGKDGCILTNLSHESQSLLQTWDLETTEEHGEDYISIRNVAGNSGVQFAHAALVRLLNWNRPTGEKISWRQEGRKSDLNTIQDFRLALSKAIDENIVQHIFDVVPRTKPEFLEY